MKAQKFILVIFTFALLSGCGNKSGRSFDSDTKSSGIQSELSLPTTAEDKIQNPSQTLPFFRECLNTSKNFILHKEQPSL